MHVTHMRKARNSSLRKCKPSKVSTSSTPSMTARNMNDPEPPTVVKKPQSMTSLYVDPISIEPNVDMSKDCPVMINVMEYVEASETSNRPRYVTTLSKPSMIVTDRDDVDKNFCVLISQVFKPDVNSHTLSPEKSQDKERSREMTNELGNKDKNPVEKNDQLTDIFNVDELDYDDVHIGKRIAHGIAKRLKNRKGQVVGSSSTPSYSVRNKANVGPTKRWSKVVTPVSKKKSFKRKEVLIATL
ncbi:hypothetical protein KIW84_073529 [Lathyrus oleraceus]|uniref:Uncharacterized protein n=1 Tax=Pisum sativum TaxID=3888 RepID=A0A9D4VPQ8_PEA|nr:hypothetical protein KIW84_073529 [Pisum sativum]